MKWDDQVKISVSKANKALGTLRRSFKCWDAVMFKQLFEMYVRPSLEYAASAWNPYNQGDIEKLERVQRRATRLVPGIKHLDYEDRLVHLKMQSLVSRRARGDLIQMYKCCTGKNAVEWLQTWSTSQVPTTGPSGNTRRAHWLVKEKSTVKQRDNFFKNSVLDTWNALPDSTKASSSTNAFKNNLDGRSVSDRSTQFL